LISSVFQHSPCIVQIKDNSWSFYVLPHCFLARWIFSIPLYHDVGGTPPQIHFFYWHCRLEYFTWLKLMLTSPTDPWVCHINVRYTCNSKYWFTK
jgi:hypothetical protein